MVANRIALPLLNSLIVTGALFAFMYSLIYVKEPELSFSTTLPPVNWGDIPEDSEVKIITPKPKKPPLVEELPVSPKDTTPIIMDPIDGPGWPDYIVGKGGGPTSLLPSDNQLVIALAYPPEYPNRALTRGIEGFVVVGFSVNAAGSVYDAHILEVDPKGYFEKSALKAIAKFKYRAQTVNGKPVSTDGQRYLFRYELDKG